MTGSTIDIKELTDNSLEEAAGLINRREYNLSIVRSRQTAEMLIKNYASEKGVEYTTLADTIEKLFSEGIINRTSRDAFHNIRLYGNKAVHENDDDPEDAQKAYYLLKNEVGTFLSRKTVSVDRTPVRIDTVKSKASENTEDREDAVRVQRRRKHSGEDAELNVDTDSFRRRVSAGRDSENEEEERRGHRTDSSERRSADGRRRRSDSSEYEEERTERRSSEHSGRRSSGNGSSGRNTSGRRSASQGRNNAKRRSSEEGSGFTIYDLLRILIPVIVIILLIIIIRSLLPAKKPAETTAAPTQAETTIAETVPETTIPPTEPETEPPVYEYKIKGDSVNVRYADNEKRVYTQLANGTVIGQVEEIEGSDFVSFTLDGVNVIVNKNYIEPVQ